MTKKTFQQTLEANFPADLVDAVLHDYDTLDATIDRVGADRSALIDLLDALLLDMERGTR